MSGGLTSQRASEAENVSKSLMYMDITPEMHPHNMYMSAFEEQLGAKEFTLFCARIWNCILDNIDLDGGICTFKKPIQKLFVLIFQARPSYRIQ